MHAVLLHKQAEEGDECVQSVRQQLDSLVLELVVGEVVDEPLEHVVYLFVEPILYLQRGGDVVQLVSEYVDDTEARLHTRVRDYLQQFLVAVLLAPKQILEQLYDRDVKLGLRVPLDDLALLGHDVVQVDDEVCVLEVLVSRLLRIDV